jgi:cell division protein FtsB
MGLSPVQIMERLEAIEHDLETRQEEYEQAAEDRHKLVRDFEMRIARGSLAAHGSTATEKKWRAMETVAVNDDLYTRLTEAEGKYEGLKAVVRVLEQRASIGQSLLRAHGRA